MNIEPALHHASWTTPQLLMTIPFILGLIGYFTATAISNSRFRKWPFLKTASWVLGTGFATLAVAGPIAARSHTDFTIHMTGHLLLGMLAPLLMVLASPVTLALRALPVHLARKLSRLLRSRPVRFLSDPVTASLLNMGGLWVLYTTELYPAMHQNILIHIVVHVHIFLAGYLFTASFIYMDPAPHRRSFMYRSIVLIAALASHSILSKYIYAHPPAGVPDDQAEAGGMLMYYGGDVIDFFLIFLLCLQWYKASRPRIPVSAST